MDNERWELIRSIETGKHEYSVSTFGRIYNHSHQKIKEGVLKHEGPYTYKCLIFQFNGVKKWHKIHQLVGEHFLDNDEQLPCLGFKDGDRTNCRLDNLVYRTYSEMALNRFSSRSATGHKNIQMYGERFKVRKHYKGRSKSKICDTIEEAIEWRNGLNIIEALAPPEPDACVQII